MFLTPEQIHTNIQWLLANGSPPVQYQTLKYLLKEDPRSEHMDQLWENIRTGPESETIFTKQLEDGAWYSGGDWSPTGYRRKSGKGYTISRPKFVTTAWLVPYLGEMGFTTQDERVRKSCELMLSEINFPQPDPGAKPANCCGLDSIPLRAFASVGMDEDERMKKGWDWLLHCQRDDGGWLNPNHLADSKTPSRTKGRWPWDRSCAWGSYFATQALYYSGKPEHKLALSRALGFLLWHLQQHDKAHLQTFVYHGHNIVKELLMFSESGIDMHTPPIPALLNWLQGYYRPAEGVFRTQEKPIPVFIRHINAIIKAFEALYGPGYWESIPKVSPGVLRYQLFHLVEDDWLTYYLTRIGQNLLET